MHQIILEPEEDHLDARNLLQLIDRWYVALDVEPITLIGYKDKMVYFVNWWSDVGPKHDWRLTKSLLEAFERHLRSVNSDRYKEPLSHNTRHAIVRAVRMMFRWAWTSNRTVKNFGDWLPWPEGSAPTRKALRSFGWAFDKRSLFGGTFCFSPKETYSFLSRLSHSLRQGLLGIYSTMPDRTNQ